MADTPVGRSLNLMTAAAIETHGLHMHYGEGRTEVRALDGVDLTIEEGEMVAIMGPSGSGKSTLLHIVGALESPTSGTDRGRRPSTTKASTTSSSPSCAATTSGSSSSSSTCCRR